MELVKEVYLLAKTHPKEEMFALPSQTKRAAVSIPPNRAEGMGRGHGKGTTHFLHIARGGADELKTQLNVALLINVIEEKIFQKVLSLVEDPVRLLNGLINYTEKAELK